MNRVYRILRKAYAERPFSGEGAYRFGARWSRVGTRIAYTAEHLSLAMVEYFVHLEVGDPPTDLVVAAADVPESVSRTAVSTDELPADWRAMPALPRLAAIGDRFVSEAKYAVLLVPSAVVPVEFNWLLNPAHREFERITLLPVESFAYDARFFK